MASAVRTAGAVDIRPHAFDLRLLCGTNGQRTCQTAHVDHQAVRARLPAIEVVPAGAFAAAEGKSNQPHNGDKNCGNPQEMHCESGAEQEQNEQQREYQYHATSLPNSGLHKPCSA
jgi:hypothetical protein